MASKKLTNEDVMRKLKGPKGTKVAVRVLRRGVEGLLDYTITRDAIPTYSVDIAYRSVRRLELYASQRCGTL